MDAKKTWALTEDMMHGHFIADASSDNDLKYALRHKLPGQSYKNGMGIRYALANEGFVRGFKHVGNNTFQAQNLKGLTISVETESDGDRLRVRNVWFNDSKPAKDAVPHTSGAMPRWRMFGDSVKAMKFILWCEKNGIRTTGQNMKGTGAMEVLYESTPEQERSIPAVFNRM